MTVELENLFVDCIGDFRDIKSTIVILQNAIENEFAKVDLQDIDHYLSIVLEKFDRALEKSDELHSAMNF